MPLIRVPEAQSAPTNPLGSASALLLSVVLTLAAVLAPAGALASAPSPGSLFLYPERLTLDDGRQVEAERGMLFVPAVRAEPEKGVIGVEIYRFRAGQDASADTPPIVVLHGGPGWPGLGSRVESADYWEGRIEPFTEVAELWVVGQRGIGSSKPDTLCPPVDLNPDSEPTGEEVAVALAKASRDCAGYWRQRGLALEGFNVIEAAADVADLAQAMGEEKVILWGGSFGSHWGMAILRHHPELVARAVLTGLEGPDHTYDMPGHVLLALERIAAAAEADPELAPHIPEGGLLEAFREVIAKAEKGPLEVSIPDPESGELKPVRLTAEDVRDMAMGITGSARSRRGLPRWPKEILSLYHGDYASAALRNLDGTLGMPNASFFMLDCGSGISQARLAELTSDPAVATVGPIGQFYQQTCPSWDSDLGEDFRTNFYTDIPTVLVHGNWDLSTPFENALELAPFFRQGHFVVVHGGSHGAMREAMGESEDFRQALYEFVRSGERSSLPKEVHLSDIDWELPEAKEKATETAVVEAEALVELAERYLHTLYDPDFEAMAAFLTEDSVWEDPSLAYFDHGPRKIEGSEGILDFYRQSSLGGATKTTFTVEDHFVTGERVAMEVLYATQGDGVHLGYPGLEVSFTVRGFTVLTIEQGKILHHLDHVDYASMMQQVEAQAREAGRL